MPFIANKLYYKIREVCEIVGVEAHVLRFWESEFPALSPPKTKTGQRIYRPKDIELLLRIRRLLYEEGFTIAGARKQLSASAPAAANREKLEEAAPAQVEHSEPRPSGSGPAEPDTDHLKKVKAELQNILTLLDRE
jgi:DNA-binding transcriptional MerR regulator